MTNPYVFIVGCPRSGTTLLRRILDAHRQIAIVPESHWIPRFFEERKGLNPDGLVTPEIIPYLLDHPRFVKLHIGADELQRLLGTGQRASYADFVGRIFDLYGTHRCKSLVGDKTPGYVRRIDTLHALWPTARFVHLIRDGRDVCLSVADWPKAQKKKPGVFATWKEDSVSTTAFWWELSVRAGRQAASLLGPELYYEMRYESLIDNTEEECNALCAFLKLPYDDAMLRFHEGRTRTKVGLDAKHAWLPITPGLRNWRSQMPGGDVERFEAAAGGLLGELGYPLNCPNPRLESLETAARMRDVLAQDANWIETVSRPPVEGIEPASTIRDLRVDDQGLAGSFEGRT